MGDQRTAGRIQAMHRVGLSASGPLDRSLVEVNRTIRTGLQIPESVSKLFRPHLNAVLCIDLLKSIASSTRPAGRSAHKYLTREEHAHRDGFPGWGGRACTRCDERDQRRAAHRIDI